MIWTLILLVTVVCMTFAAIEVVKEIGEHLARKDERTVAREVVKYERH